MNYKKKISAKLVKQANKCRRCKEECGNKIYCSYCEDAIECEKDPTVKASINKKASSAGMDQWRDYLADLLGEDLEDFKRNNFSLKMINHIIPAFEKELSIYKDLNYKHADPYKIGILEQKLNYLNQRRDILFDRFNSDARSDD